MTGGGKWLAGLILLGLTAASGAQELAPVPLDPIEGTWQTQLKSEVTITICPEGFCGFLSKIIVPEGMLSGAEAEAAAAMRPEDFFDQRNKDPALRDRPMLGLQILTLVPSDKPNIYDGEIYNPEDGNTYSGYMELVSADLVRLNGCVLFNVICRGEDWVRVVVTDEEGAATP
jgi:uncharacterized protein (DUF2147 family)